MFHGLCGSVPVHFGACKSKKAINAVPRMPNRVARTVCPCIHQEGDSSLGGEQIRPSLWRSAMAPRRASPYGQQGPPRRQGKQSPPAASSQKMNGLTLRRRELGPVAGGAPPWQPPRRAEGLPTQVGNHTPTRAPIPLARVGRVSAVDDQLVTYSRQTREL